MNRDEVYKQLKIDEGVEYKIYKDHLGYPTFGVGHLITENDVEFKQPVNTPISEQRVKECFEKDLNVAINECEVLYGKSTFNSLHSIAQEVLVNMMFNLGRPRLSAFKKFNAAILENNWKKAANEGRDSRWYEQVSNRAERLMERLESI